MKFTALEIGSGDAFLLETGERIVLFDSGGNKKTIVNLLNKKGIEKIDLAICSHNDIDHANGFIGLLDSNISIDEIWLPGLWAHILQFAKDNDMAWDINFNFSKEYENFYNDEFAINSLYDNESIPCESFNDDLSYFSELIDSTEFYKEQGYLYYLSQNKTITLNLMINLDKIIKIAGLAYRKGSKIRWFEPSRSNLRNIIDYGFMALNAQELYKVHKLKGLTEYMRALQLTDANRYSLVFEYQKNEIPIVRFSADSDCTYQSTNPYLNNIIITAPHHGSDNNKGVYSEIGGKDIIWIRSGKPRQRPCSSFKNLNNKYCLACNSKNIKCEICFEYDSTKMQWVNLHGNQCHC